MLSSFFEIAKVEPVGPSLKAEASAQGLSTFDKRSQVFYFIGYNYSTSHTHLIGLDARDGKLIYSVYLPFANQQFVGRGEYCEFNENVSFVNKQTFVWKTYVECKTKTGEVLVVGPSMDDKKLHHIFSVNPSTGNLTFIGKVEGGDILENKSGFDPKRNILLIYYTQQLRAILFAVSIPSGKILYSIRNPDNLECMNYVPSLGLFFGIGLTSFNSTHSVRTLVSLDPQNGHSNVLRQYKQFKLIQAAMSAYSAKTNVLYTFLSDVNNDANMYLVGFDLSSGFVKHQHVSCVPWSITCND